MPADHRRQHQRQQDQGPQHTGAPGSRCGPAPAPSARRTATHQVLAVDVFRLSQNAVRESSEVISEPKWAQSTLARIATSGSSTNAAPTSAGAYTHRGSPTGRGACGPVAASIAAWSWLGEAGLLEDGPPGIAGHEVDEVLREVGVLRVLESHDRVGVHRWSLDSSGTSSRIASSPNQLDQGGRMPSSANAQNWSSKAGGTKRRIARSGRYPGVDEDQSPHRLNESLGDSGQQ